MTRINKPQSRYRILLAALSILLISTSCKKNNNDFDASGTFESEEIIVSAEVSGRILEFKKEEGAPIRMDEVVVKIDPVSLSLQKETLEASLGAIPKKANSAGPQISVIEQQIVRQTSEVNALEAQMAQVQREKERIRRLLLAEAATQKQLDDIESQEEILKERVDAGKQQIQVLKSQIEMQRDVVAIQNRGLFSEEEPIRKQIEQIEDKLNRTDVKSPISGMLLTKYMYAGEFAMPGKALFKIADMEHMVLRAYITGSQLPRVKLGQKVDVFVDDGPDSYRELEGTITWVADEAEFTPKTIQTKDERADLVYAIKVNVPNDGSLKIGMYGELKLKEES